MPLPRGLMAVSTHGPPGNTLRKELDGGGG